MNYDGSLSDYTMTKNDDGSVTITHPTKGSDTLKGIDGFWFNDEAKWYSMEEALEKSGHSDDAGGDPYDPQPHNSGDYYQGGDGDDVWNDQKGDQTYDGGNGGYDQVNYDGSLSDYTVTKNDDGSITVSHKTDGTDTLKGIDGFWFNDEGAWYSTEYAIEETSEDDDHG